MAQETVTRFNPSQPLPILTHGLPYPEALAKHITTTLHCSRPFIIISKSLATNTDALDRLKTVLEASSSDVRGTTAIKIAGVRIGMQPHTYYSEVLDVTRAVAASAADVVVTIGGGSLTDAAKAVVLLLANPEAATGDLDDMHALLSASDAFRPSVFAARTDSSAPLPAINSPALPIVCVPTTLSAGEYNPPGGCTHDVTKYKQLFFSPAGKAPAVLVLDAGLVGGTPERVWLSTGMRALDHCVETICSDNARSEGTEASLRGVRALVPGLLGVKRDPRDEGARLKCMLGAAESMKASVLWKVHVGGSHGIGHQLGPIGVPHAETTCVCLPAVQKFNAPVNGATQQATVLDAFWAEPAIADVLAARGLVRGEADLGDALDAIIRELGLPRTLKEYGIGRERLDEIAESSLKDVCCAWNVIPLVRKEQVLEILEMCLGDQ